MRECCGGRHSRVAEKHKDLPRASSQPNMRMMIPSEDMGEYEDPGRRRRSAPEKKKGGLFPLNEEGEYGAPPAPANLPKPLPGYQKRERKAKVYASYAVSNDCHLHADKLEKNEKDRGKTPPRTLPRSRRTSTSSRASPSPRPSRSRTTSASPDRFRQAPSPSPARQTSDNGYGDNGYSAIKNIANAVKSQNGFSSSKYKSTSYNKVSRDMRESSFEEKEEFEYQNGGNDKRDGSKISLGAIREPEFDYDAMGILGLSNLMFNSSQTKQSSFISQNFTRKESVSTHVM